MLYRKSRLRSSNCLQKTPPKAKSVKLRRFIPTWRTVASAITVSTSLWIVAAASGIVDSASHELEIGVDLDPLFGSAKRSDTLTKKILNRELFIGVELTSNLTADPPPLFNAFYPKERSPNHFFVDEGAANIEISLWKDDKFSVPITDPGPDNIAVEFLLMCSREIVPVDATPKNSLSIQKLSKDDFAKRNISNRFQSGSAYWVKVSQGFYAGPLLSSGYRYNIPIHFVRPLDAGKGLAQLEWHQTVDLRWAANTNYAVGNLSSFRPRFDDVRILRNPAIEKFPATTVTDILYTVGGYTNDARSYLLEPPAFSVRAVDSRRKDIVDFLLFSMAALFGAAAAALFDSITKKLE